MMRKFFLIAVIVFFTISCAGPNNEAAEELKTSIELMEEKLYNSQDIKLSKNDALELIDLYETYAIDFPKDSLAAIYLFRASDLSMNLQRPEATIALFNELLVKYPDYEKTPSVLFLKAFVYEDQLGDLVNAKKYYEEFLEKYPENDFADDAEISLKNLGKTPEELIREFENME